MPGRIQSWPEIMSAVQEEGLRMAKQLTGSRVNRSKWAILAPREVKGGDTIPLKTTVLLLPLDWKIAKRREMVDPNR